MMFDDVHDARELIAQAVGAGSRCWVGALREPEFDSVLAAKVADAAFLRLQALLAGALVAPRPDEVAPDRDSPAIDELCEALRLTVEYVGLETLQPVGGWSWFDALRKYRPDMAAALTSGCGEKGSPLMFDDPVKQVIADHTYHLVEARRLAQHSGAGLPELVLDNLKNAIGHLADAIEQVSDLCAKPEPSPATDPGKYTLWLDYGCEGWHPYVCDSVADCFDHMRSYGHSGDYRITRPVTVAFTAGGVL